MIKGGDTMFDRGETCTVDFAETFEYRKPVLDDIIPGRWQLTTVAIALWVSSPISCK
jgi:hypothetical protein